MPAIRSIIVRPERRATPVRVSQAEMTNVGIKGDHYAKEGGSRQIMLIANDGLVTVAAAIGFQGD